MCKHSNVPGQLTFKLECELIWVVEGEHLLVRCLIICVEDELSGEHEHRKASFHQLRLSMMLLLHWLQLSSFSVHSLPQTPTPLSTNHSAAWAPFWCKQCFSTHHLKAMTCCWGNEEDESLHAFTQNTIFFYLHSCHKDFSPSLYSTYLCIGVVLLHIIQCTVNTNRGTNISTWCNLITWLVISTIFDHFHETSGHVLLVMVQLVALRHFCSRTHKRENLSQKGAMRQCLQV